MASSRISALMIPAVALLLMIIAGTEAQQVPACASKLASCVEYLNATVKPPSACCGPLEEAVTKELSCLCNLYENPEFLKAAGINITQAQNLPVLCGIPGDLNACNGTKAASPSGSSSNTPPGTPGGNGGSSGVDRIVGAGFSSLVLLVASSMVLF